MSSYPELTHQQFLNLVNSFYNEAAKNKQPNIGVSATDAHSQNVNLSNKQNFPKRQKFTFVQEPVSSQKYDNTFKSNIFTLERELMRQNPNNQNIQKYITMLKHMEKLHKFSGYNDFMSNKKNVLKKFLEEGDTNLLNNHIFYLFILFVYLNVFERKKPEKLKIKVVAKLLSNSEYTHSNFLLALEKLWESFDAKTIDKKLKEIIDVMASSDDYSYQNNQKISLENKIKLDNIYKIILNYEYSSSRPSKNRDTEYYFINKYNSIPEKANSSKKDPFTFVNHTNSYNKIRHKFITPPSQLTPKTRIHTYHPKKIQPITFEPVYQDLTDIEKVRKEKNWTIYYPKS